MAQVFLLLCCIEKECSRWCSNLVLGRQKGTRSSGKGIFQDIGIFFLNGCLGVGEVVKKVDFCSALALSHRLCIVFPSLLFKSTFDLFIDPLFFSSM